MPPVDFLAVCLVRAIFFPPKPKSEALAATDVALCALEQEPKSPSRTEDAPPANEQTVLPRLVLHSEIHLPPSLQFWD